MSHCIEWRHHGRRILLPVIILPPTPSTDLTGYQGPALLDTGSTTSGIVPRVARYLALPRRGKRPLGSAQGGRRANVPFSWSEFPLLWRNPLSHLPSTT